MKHTTSLSRQLFITVLMLFSVFVAGFVSYQYQREKQFKIGLLHTRLKDYNHQLAESIADMGGLKDSVLTAYVGNHPLRGLRITLLDIRGKVLYDNGQHPYSSMANHLERPEVKRALISEIGRAHV